MGMREKLIELLKEAMVLRDGICRIVGNTQAVAIGHYLFAHGVTIPVRCKDCTHFTEGMAIGMCKRDPESYVLPVPYNHFCSYGKRRIKDEL